MKTVQVENIVAEDPICSIAVFNSNFSTIRNNLKN